MLRGGGRTTERRKAKPRNQPTVAAGGRHSNDTRASRVVLGRLRLEAGYGIRISIHFLPSGSGDKIRFSTLKFRIRSGGFEADKSPFWALAQHCSPAAAHPLIYLMAALRICAALREINTSEREKEKLT